MPRGCHECSGACVPAPCFSTEKRLDSFLAVFFFAATLPAVGWWFWAQGIFQIYGTFSMMQDIHGYPCRITNHGWKPFGCSQALSRWGRVMTFLTCNFRRPYLDSGEWWCFLKPHSPVSNSEWLTGLRWETLCRWAADLGLWGHLRNSLFEESEYRQHWLHH